MKSVLPIILLFISICTFSFGQTGKLQGEIIDKETGEYLPFVKVILKKIDSTTVAFAASDINGFYSFNSILPGNYMLQVQSIDFETQTITNVLIKDNAITRLNVQLVTNSLLIEEVVIITSRSTNSYMTFGSSINPMGVTNGIYQEMNTESYDEFDENPFIAVNQKPLSTFSIDVDKASYSNIRRFIEDGKLPPKDAVRIEEMINYFPYNYPVPKGNDPLAFQTMLTDCPWNKKHQLIHIGVQGQTIDLAQAPANNLVFLIDVSGSMQSADKLGLVKTALYLLIDQMREEDRIAIVVYAGESGLVLPSTSGAEKRKIKEAIAELEAGGSTAGADGIKLAYKIAKEQFIKKGNNRVILATDGDFNVGINDDGELTRLIEEKRDGGIFLSVLGFGTGNLKDSKMEKLADNGNGNYAYIDNALEAKKVLVTEMGGTLVTIAKDVKLQVEFNPAQVKGYRLIGYENRLLENQDFNDDKKDAGDLGIGQTVTAIYELIMSSSDEELKSIDSLKYQTELKPKTNDPVTNELLTLKLRYKNPTDSASLLVEYAVENTSVSFEQLPLDAQFSIAVAEFGLILRDSEHKGTATFDDVVKLSTAAKGEDKQGYRSEFIQLVKKAARI